jgi:hypothetical protein
MIARVDSYEKIKKFLKLSKKFSPVKKWNTQLPFPFDVQIYNVQKWTVCTMDCKE